MPAKSQRSIHILLPLVEDNLIASLRCDLCHQVFWLSMDIV